MSLYCPLKEYNNENHGILLREILGNLSHQPTCFVGDEAGYFFSACRSINSPAISFKNKLSFIFYSLLKEDVYMMRATFMAYMERYEPKLLEIFENEIFVEQDPYIMSFKLFILFNSSQNIDDSLSNYVSYDTEYLKHKIKNFDTCFLERNNILYNEIPENHFMVCYDTEPVGNSGILITTTNRDLHLITDIDNYKYYYYRQ